VVAWLVDELVSLGHEVTLFASGDSQTSAKLHAVWPRALRLGRPRTDPMVALAALLEAVARHATEFDIIHAHIDWLHLPLLRRLGVPFLTTCHARMDLPGFADVVRRFPDAKRQFLAGAAALLFPIDWPEPFGLVMIEAMACGTPVIAFKSGSVSEVIDDGITGFVVSDKAEAVEAIGRLSELDRRQVRMQFEKRFTARRMAQEYLRRYKTLIHPDVSEVHPGIRPALSKGSSGACSDRVR
jgi:glycosyltransferase involved in cell wall biosynthesis